MVERLKMPSGKDDKVHADLTKKSNEFVDADVILFHAGRLAESAKNKKAAGALHTKARRIFKSTGITMQTFDFVEGIADQDDPAVAIDKFVREMMHIAGALSLVPVVGQVDLFHGAASTLTALEKAFSEGRIRGIMGISPDDQKYNANSDLGQEHMRGWSEGQEVLQNKFVAMNKQEADEAERKKTEEAEKIRKREERLAKAKATGEAPKTEDGQTEQ